jgi:hypothetical protein
MKSWGRALVLGALLYPDVDFWLDTAPCHMDNRYYLALSSHTWHDTIHQHKSIQGNTLFFYRG